MIPKFGHKVAGLFSGSFRRPSGSQTPNVRRRLEFESLEERTLLSWSSLASLPTPRQHFAAVTGEDGKIYAIGGQGANGQALNKLEIYDPATDAWTTGAN